MSRVNSDNIIVGSADVYFNSQYLGTTVGGVTTEYEPTMVEVEDDKSGDAVRIIQSKENFRVKVNLMEYTLDKIVNFYQKGPLDASASGGFGSGAHKWSDFDGKFKWSDFNLIALWLQMEGSSGSIGSSDSLSNLIRGFAPLEFVGPGPGGMLRTYTFNLATVYGVSTLNLQRIEAVKIPVEFKILPDITQPGLEYGQIIDSSTVTIVTGPPPPPTVTLIAPSDGSIISGTVQLIAFAQSQGSISGVQFFQNGVLIGNGTFDGTNWVLNWDTTGVSDGNYTLSVVVTDIINQTGTDQNNVTVSNALPGPPVVTWISPNTSANLAATVTLVATATSGATVTGLQFFYGTTLIGSGSLGPFGYTITWDTTTVSDGTYVLKATATDNFSQTGSATISVNVHNTAPPPNPPVINITSPANNATVTGTVTLKSNATPTSGGPTISNVKYFENNTLIGSATLSAGSWNLNWNTTGVADGAYTIKATITDSIGATASTTISVTVANNVLPPPPPNGKYVPDRRNNPDPMARIDPTLTHDSTAGLQNFITNECSTTQIIILPFDLEVNGTITLTGTQILTSVGYPGTISRKFKLIRTESFPYRVRADTRVKLPNGNSNPGYNPNGICVPWLYDIQGGQAAIPNSMNNPYGSHNASGSQYGGYDATVGYWGSGFDGKHLSAYTTPFPSNVLNQVITVLINTGKGSINIQTSASGVGNGTTTIGSPVISCPNIQQGSIPANQGILYPGIINGTITGPGIPNGTTIIAVAPDWKSATMSANATQTASNATLNIQPLSKFSKQISGISSDNMTVSWDDPSQAIVENSSTRNSAWCIGPNKAGWEVYFTPNPGWASTFFYDANHSFSAYMEALQSVGNGIGPTIQLNGSSDINGIAVIHPNSVGGVARQAITNFTASYPLVTENENHCVIDTSTTNTITNCDLLWTWADAENGPGNLQSSNLIHTGRQGCTGHWDNKVINNCVIDDNRHSCIDIEGTNNVNVTITNNTFGGNGVAFTSSVTNFTFTGNHSTQADVNAGTIMSRAPAYHVPWQAGWARPGSTTSKNVVISGNNFDIPIPANAKAGATIGNSPYQIANVVADSQGRGLTFTNNIGGPIGGSLPKYILTPYTANDINAPTGSRCNPITQSGNSVVSGTITGVVAP